MQLMTIHTMKSTQFQEADFEQWKQVAIQSLKGKPFESLRTSTIEGIDLEPLYTKQHLQERTLDARSFTQQAGWVVAQQTIATDGEQFVEQAKEDLAKGNEAIVYDGKLSITWSESALNKLATLLPTHPFVFTNVKQDDSILQVFRYVQETDRSLVKGWVASNELQLEDFPNVRTLHASTWDVHHAGADAVTELATALTYAAQLAAKEATFQEFEQRFFVSFAIDTHFFMEIAKLRAFRILWQAFASAYGEKGGEVPIIATTSVRSYSKLDPYVNLLRAGNEAFAAVLGGANILTVHPHDLLTGPTPSSIRYARNIQLVLKEETHVDKIIDSAGGSYFIETLTDQLVNDAWEKFLTIEEMGSLEAYFEENPLTGLLEKRQQMIATSKQSLVGTNIYAELTDTELTNWKGIAAGTRLAEPFEALRAQFAQEQPKTAILTFGQLKDFKPRADFVTGFLQTGGIHVTWSPAFDDIEQALNWMRREQFEYVVICATNDKTLEIVQPFMEQTKGNLIVDVAGKYDEATTAKWTSAGVHGFLYQGQHKIQKLRSIDELWKESRK